MNKKNNLYLHTQYLIAIWLIFMLILKELSIGEESFTPSDVERALWSSAIASKSPANGNPKSESKMHGKRKR